MSLTLKGTKPSAEEVAIARATLSQGDPKKVLKSKMQCLVDWARKQGDEGKLVLASDPQSDLRRTYLEEYLVLMARNKEAQKVKVLQKVTTNSKKNKSTQRKLNREQMDKELGAVAGPLIRESGKLTWEACPYTGSTCEKLRVYIIDESVVIKINEDANHHKVNLSSAASEEDLAALNTGAGAGSSTDTSAGGTGAAPIAGVSIKVEQKSRATIIEERSMQAVKAPTADLTVVQAWINTEKLWKFKASQLEMGMGAKLVDAITEHLTVLDGVVEILEAMLSGEPFDKTKEAQGAYVSLVERCEAQHMKLFKWAVTFSVESPTRGSKRKGQ